MSGADGGRTMAFFPPCHPRRRRRGVRLLWHMPHTHRKEEAKKQSTSHVLSVSTFDL